MQLEESIGLPYPIYRSDFGCAAKADNLSHPLSTSDQAQAPNGKPEFVNRFLKDPLANSIAVVVLIGMLTELPDRSDQLLARFRAANSSRHLPGFYRFWQLLEISVAFYLSYVEISNTKAVCGPVGNCNSVQESPYAHLFGLIPIGALGVVGYAAILG